MDTVSLNFRLTCDSDGHNDFHIQPHAFFMMKHISYIQILLYVSTSVGVNFDICDTINETHYVSMSVSINFGTCCMTIETIILH